MTDLPDTPAELIDRLGGTGAVANYMPAPVGRVSAWKARGSIPARYWPQIVDLAKIRRVRGVTLDYLSRMHAAEGAAA